MSRLTTIVDSQLRVDSLSPPTNLPGPPSSSSILAALGNIITHYVRTNDHAMFQCQPILRAYFTAEKKNNPEKDIVDVLAACEEGQLKALCFQGMRMYVDSGPGRSNALYAAVKMLRAHGPPHMTGAVEKVSGKTVLPQAEAVKKDISVSVAEPARFIKSVVRVGCGVASSSRDKKVYRAPHDKNDEDRVAVPISAQPGAPTVKPEAPKMDTATMIEQRTKNRVRDGSWVEYTEESPPLTVNVVAPQQEVLKPVSIDLHDKKAKKAPQREEAKVYGAVSLVDNMQMPSLKPRTKRGRYRCREEKDALGDNHVVLLEKKAKSKMKVKNAPRRMGWVECDPIKNADKEWEVVLKPVENDGEDDDFVWVEGDE